MKVGAGSVRVSVPKRTIRISGTISLKTVRRVLRAIRDMQRKNLDPIVVIIGYSRGGCAIAGCALYGVLRTAASPVYTVVERLAWSAACYVFLAGQYRVMFKRAKIGLHSAVITQHAYATRNFTEAYSDLMYIATFNEKLIELVRQSTGLPKKKIHELLMKNKLFDVKTALQLRLATDSADGRHFYRSIKKKGMR